MAMDTGPYFGMGAKETGQIMTPEELREYNAKQGIGVKPPPPPLPPPPTVEETVEDVKTFAPDIIGEEPVIDIKEAEEVYTPFTEQEKADILKAADIGEYEAIESPLGDEYFKTKEELGQKKIYEAMYGKGKSYEQGRMALAAAGLLRSGARVEFETETLKNYTDQMSDLQKGIYLELVNTDKEFKMFNAELKEKHNQARSTLTMEAQKLLQQDEQFMSDVVLKVTDQKLTGEDLKLKYKGLVLGLFDSIMKHNDSSYATAVQKYGIDLANQVDWEKIDLMRDDVKEKKRAGVADILIAQDAPSDVFNAAMLAVEEGNDPFDDPIVKEWANPDRTSSEEKAAGKYVGSSGPSWQGTAPGQVYKDTTGRKWKWDGVQWW